MLIKTKRDVFWFQIEKWEDFHEKLRFHKNTLKNGRLPLLNFKSFPDEQKNKY